MRSLLFLVITLLFSLSVNAFEKPGYCTNYYDVIYDLKSGPENSKALLPVETDPTKAGFQLNLTVKDLIENSVYAKDPHILSDQQKLEDDTLTVGLRNFLRSANSYAGFYTVSADQKIKSELMTCVADYEPTRGLVSVVDDDLETQTELNKESREEFFITSLERALLIQALQTYISNFNAEDDEYTRAVRNCYRNAALRASDQVLIQPSGCEQYSKVNEKLETRFREEAQAQTDLLNIMVTNNHLLVTIENDFEVLNWFNSKVILSDFSKELVSFVSDDVKRALSEAVAGKKDQYQIMTSFNKIRSQNRSAIIRLYQRVIEESNVVNAFKRSYIDFLNKVYGAALFHCKNKGKFLHYHEGVINSRAYNLTRLAVEKNRDPKDHKNEIISLQANQCRRWRESPYQDSDEWTGRTTFGITMLVTGGVIAFLPGVGPVLSPGLVIAGTAMLGWKSYDDHAIAQINLKNEEYAYLNSWSDLRGVIKEVDRIYDVRAQALMESIFLVAGVSGKGRRLISRVGEKIVVSPRHLQNLAARSGNTALERANGIHRLINQRYKDNPADLTLTNGWITNRLRKWTGNTDISARIRRGGEGGQTHYDILELGAARHGSPRFNQGRFQSKTQEELEELTTEALDEIKRIAKDADLHLLSRAEKIREGQEAEENLKILQLYLEKIDQSFFRNGDVAIPKFDDPKLRVVKRQPSGLILRFPKMKFEMNANGGRFVDDGFDDISMRDWRAVESKRKEWDESFKENFTQNALQEWLRKSDLSSEIHAQAYRFYFLQTAERMFEVYASGVRYDDAGNVIQYLGLSQAQNDLALMIRAVLSNDAVRPRKGAYERLVAQASTKEFVDLIFGAVGRGVRSSKYSRELASGLAFASEISKLRVMIVAAAGAGGIFGMDKFAERSEIFFYPFNTMVEAYRSAERVVNTYTDRFGSIAAYPFTSSEKDCAQESRDWTVENVCLEKEIRQEFWREIYESRVSEDVDFTTDPIIKRKVRDYIRRYLKNREAFQDGAVNVTIGEIRDDVAQENEREIIKNQIDAAISASVKLAAANSIELLNDLDRLIDEPNNQELIDSIKESISKLENSEDFLPLFESILDLMQTNFPYAVQAPGSDDKVGRFLQYLIKDVREQ